MVQNTMDSVRICLLLGELGIATGVDRCEWNTSELDSIQAWVLWRLKDISLSVDCGAYVNCQRERPMIELGLSLFQK